MDYYRIDDSYLISLITWLPKVVVFEIVEYTYAKCANCKHYLLQKFKCNNCKIIRCQYHAWMNTSKIRCQSCHDTIQSDDYILCEVPNNVRITCIIPNCHEKARYGYKHSVYYCGDHYMKKYKIIKYNYCVHNDCCFVTNMIDLTTISPLCTKHKSSNMNYDYDKN